VPGHEKGLGNIGGGAEDAAIVNPHATFLSLSRAQVILFGSEIPGRTFGTRDDEC
jgi:hypothetical protein